MEPQLDFLSSYQYFKILGILYIIKDEVDYFDEKLAKI